jgi:hypothetical protein
VNEISLEKNFQRLLFVHQIHLLLLTKLQRVSKLPKPVFFFEFWEEEGAVPMIVDNGHPLGPFFSI